MEVEQDDINSNNQNKLENNLNNLSNLNNEYLNSGIEDNSLANLENNLEKIFELFANSTANIISNSDILSSDYEKSIDLKNSDLHKNRIDYENINLNKVNSLQEDIKQDVIKFKQLFESIDDNLLSLSKDSNYNKSEKELLEELRLTKEKQQEEMNMLDNLVKTAKEALNTLEINSKINNMFN